MSPWWVPGRPSPLSQPLGTFWDLRQSQAPPLCPHKAILSSGPIPAEHRTGGNWWGTTCGLRVHEPTVLSPGLRLALPHSWRFLPPPLITQPPLPAISSRKTSRMPRRPASTVPGWWGRDWATCLHHGISSRSVKSNRLLHRAGLENKQGPRLFSFPRCLPALRREPRSSATVVGGYLVP